MIDNMNEYYENLWSRRHDIQPKIVDKNWSKGRMKHLAFLYRITDEDIVQRVKNVQNELGQYDCYDPFPLDYMHVTVKVIGFLNDNKEYRDDFTDSELDYIMKRSEAAFSSFEKFEIKISGVNIVPQVTFAQILDDGIFTELNKAVLEIPGVIKRESRDFPNFMPHITMGRFKSAEDFGSLIRSVEGKFRNFTFGTASVEKIELVIVHLEGEYPVIETIRSYNLK